VKALKIIALLALAFFVLAAAVGYKELYFDPWLHAKFGCSYPHKARASTSRYCM
jgi:hypothetical protein